MLLNCFIIVTAKDLKKYKISIRLGELEKYYTLHKFE